MTVRPPTTTDFDRDRLLPRLVAVGPEELADRGPEGRAAMVRRLVAALRGERRRGRAGHWSYSLDRHVALLQALAAERLGLSFARRSAAGGGAESADRTGGRGARVLKNETAADRRGPRRLVGT